jgi:predicted enzyme related to lactoylglutathione lyase
MARARRAVLVFPPFSLEITMSNPFVHVELSTTDVPAAKAFYGKLFDWKLEDMPMPGGAYTMIQVGSGTGGGLMQQQIPGAPSSWLAYVEVDDIAAATKKAKALGASVMKDVTEVMGAGWLSIIVDPTGAALGLWKPKR